jgi:chemotaxis protein histidine kinase CheA
MTILELQARFLAGLEHRLTDLTELLSGAADPEALMRRFHSITGIAGTYGFHHITDIGRSCEDLCVSAIDSTRTLTIPEVNALKKAVVDIKACAARDPS